MAEPADPDSHLEELCRILNHFKVGYIVFGSHVARLNGLPLETIDVDVVPARLADNLTRLAEALNLLRPRWRVDIEHLAALYHHFPQLAAGPEQLPPAPE